jgi:hypothetical protein
MRTLILLGILLFLGFCIAFAPAGLTSLILDRMHGVDMTRVSGTLWQGEGDLYVRSEPLGRLQWDVHPATLLEGALGGDFALTDAHHELRGTADVGLNRTFTVDVSGKVGAQTVNRWLEPYDMTISGTINLSSTLLTFDAVTLRDAGGAVDWEGGSITYPAGNGIQSSILPPLRATLGPGPAAIITTRDDAAPLVTAELFDNGIAKVGVTARMTRLLDLSWTETEPDSAVVLEVEEQVF